MYGRVRFLRFLQDNLAFLSVGVLLAFLSSFGQTYFISVFAGVIQEEFALSAGAWGAIYSSGTMVSAAIMVWAGALTDRFRVRLLAVWVLVGLSLSCLAMAFAPTAIALPFVILALRFFGQGMSSHVAMVAMARWFMASRGRALAIASLGFALGEAFLPLLFVWLLSFAPWRHLWVGAALLPVALLPLIFRLLRAERTPQASAEASVSAGMCGRHWKRSEALRHWLFWLMVPAVLGPSAFGTAFFFQQVHLAEVKGWSHLELVSLFPLYTATTIISMLGSGWAVDRFGAGRLIPLFQLPVAAAFFVLSAADTLGAAAVGIILMGFTFGANATLPGAFWAEFYGTRHLGGIKALATAVMVLGSALGPGLTGVLIDLGVSFPDQMLAISIWFLMIAALTAFGLFHARKLIQSAA